MDSPGTMWEAAFILSVVLLIIGSIVAVVLYRQPRRNAIVRPLTIIILTVFVAMAVVYYPAYVWRLGAEDGGSVESLLLSIQTAFKVFKIDNVYDVYVGPLQDVQTWVKAPYTIYTTVLYMCAPFLLLSFVLSFIKSVSAYCAYVLSYHREVYVFSKLSSRSLTLARSVLAHYKKVGRRLPQIVFAGASLEADSTAYGLYEAARDLRCICFRKDILSLRLDIHSKRARMNFILIGDSHHENNTQALRLLERPAKGEKPNYAARRRENTWLYVIDSSKGTELLLDGKTGAMTIRRIDHARQFIHNLLWEDLWDAQTGEHALFSTAVAEDSLRRISVLLVGLGKNGTALLKALAWFGQMEGYALEIHALDHDHAAEEKFRFQCPELLDERYNHKSDPNEAIHSITIHSGVDTNKQVFSDLVKELAGTTTLAFVSLGNGERNIDAALNLRVLMERYAKGTNPRPPIYAVLHDSEKISMLTSVSDFSEENYFINLIGDYQELFSYQMIFDPRLEGEALQYHIFWSVKSTEDASEKEVKKKTGEFWSKEYYRNSSISRVIHNKAVRKYGPLSEENRKERTEAEIALAAGMLEHRRWNAYMRSEGYVYNDVRNNLAKQHNLLVRYDELPLAEQEKDFKKS
ncbi:MAG: hypothetical protein LBP91_01410 [Coriobacteriales bacterium]|jgi:hypothetical protein|nr:hypothetical protein [Coriobacteriales bacterium]